MARNMRTQLKTRRLVLRPPELADAADIARLINDRDIARMTGSIPSPYFDLCAKYWIFKARAERRALSCFNYVIEDVRANVLGVTGVFLNSENGFELGYWLGKPYWGQGFISEANLALLSETFASLGVEKIFASCFDDNPGSLRVLKKLGFTPVGKTDTLYSIARGGCAPGTDFELTHQDWRKIMHMRVRAYSHKEGSGHEIS